MAAIVDRVIHIIDKNNLTPEEIEKIEVTPHAIGLNRMWRENKLTSEEDFGFHGPYLIACAVHRIKPIDFQNPEIRKDLRIRQFMKKVKMLPNHHKDFGPSMLEDPIARVMSVKVWARGKEFKETSRYIDWSWRPDEVRAADKDLVDKFNDIAMGVLPSDKIKKATDTLLKLEEVEDIKDLMEMLVP